MGHRSKLFGYIEELDAVNHEHTNLYQQRNEAGIAALPLWTPADDRPLITRDMFALPIAGYLNRLLPFGRAYSGVEGHWDRWRAEFETLLRTLYWDEVYVSVETDCWGSYQCTWTRSYSDEEQEQVAADQPLGPTLDWTYRGPTRAVLR
jgi:hypothetical protein